MSYHKEELLNLPAEEKYELVMDLWESLDKDFAGNRNTTLSFEEEIDNRIDRIEKNPETLIPWEDVKNNMKD